VNFALVAGRSLRSLVKDWEAAVQLAYDVLQLGALLALTGGVQNPFVFLFVAPVAVSAAVLRPGMTAALAGLCFATIGVLALWHLPLPWRAGVDFLLPEIYQVGMTAAAMTCVGFTSIYAWRIAAEEERLNLALAATEAVLAREQRLSALGGLAAAAAHELGTPLATIHLVAKEMARELPEDAPLREDAQLLVSQSERCRAILTQLGRRGEAGDAMVARAELRDLLDEIAAHHQGLGADVTILLEGRSDDKAPAVRRLPEVLHAVGAFVENAVGFARTKVELRARWSEKDIELAVFDDGPGFSPAVLSRIGEPYVTERSQDSAGGLGLGFFIAKTLLERSGGEVSVANRLPPQHGAIVRVVWPRHVLEAPPL
jgi:two-component system sensor histidine kinase RegB